MTIVTKFVITKGLRSVHTVGDYLQFDANAKNGLYTQMQMHTHSVKIRSQYTFPCACANCNIVSMRMFTEKSVFAQ